MKLKRFTKWSSSHRSLLLTVVGVGVLGTVFLSLSSAATYSHNPDGDVDYCRLEGSSTVLYGWAYDPDAPAGAQPYVTANVNTTSSTVPSSQAGYRDSGVNTYLNEHYPGAPTPGTYGWRLALSGLYKGGSYVVSGTVLNYGTGANVALPVNRNHFVDGNSANTYFNSNYTIPDTCLATRPAPTPTPTPTPVTPPKKTTSPPKTTAPVTISAPTSNADATVTAGTLSASIVVPADGATKVHLVYGLASSTSTLTSDDQAVTGSSTTITLNDLAAKTAYSYTIVRNNGIGQTATSPAASFTTRGYDLVMKFLDSKGNGIQGIKASLNDSKTQVTSDKNGSIGFRDVNGGTLSVTYNYQGHTHIQMVDTAHSDSVADDENIVTLLTSVNVSKLTSSSDSKPMVTNKKSAAGLIIALVIGLAAVAFGIVLVLRRRSSQPKLAYIQPDIIDKQTHEHFKKNPPIPNEPPPEHMGESLREMVIKSMHEEAQRRKQPPQDPPT